MNRITALIVGQIVTLVLGFAALGFTVKTSHDDRASARRDTCVLIVGLARAAAGPSKKALAEANAYIKRTPLHNCNDYANNIGVTRHDHTRK